MRNKWSYFLVFGVILLVAFFVVNRRTWAEKQWLFYSQLPIPAEARNLQVGHFTDSSDHARRETHFDVERPEDVETIRAFYRAELPKRGLHRDKWTINCGEVLWPREGFRDTYYTNNWSVSISNFITDQQIEVTEYQTGSPVVAPPEDGLQGNWRSVNQDSDAPFMLCFDDDRSVILAYTQFKSIGGLLQRAETAINIAFEDSELIRPEEVELKKNTFCSELPALFRNSCQIQIIDPESYPRPESDPTSPSATTNSAPASQPNQGPYPVPPPYPIPGVYNGPIWTVVIRVNARFTITLDQDTLTLTSDTGDTQVFQRVVPQ